MKITEIDFTPIISLYQDHKDLIDLAGIIIGILISIATILISVINIYISRKDKRKEHENQIWYRICRSSQISLSDLDIQKRGEHYVNTRDNIPDVENAIKKNEHILIYGQGRCGKSTEVYEAIKKQSNYYVFIPKKRIKGVVCIPKKYKNKNIILILEEIDKFESLSMDELVTTLKRDAKTLSVIATYNEDEIRNDKSFGLRIEFKTAKLNRLIEDPIQDLKIITDNFDQLKDTEKNFLKGILLLKEANLYCTMEYLKIVIEKIFEIPNYSLTEYEWRQLSEDLLNSKFLKVDYGIIQINETQLDQKIAKYNPNTLNDLNKLYKILVENKDWSGLFYLGNSYLSKKDNVHAKKCFISVLSIYPEYSSAYFKIGSIFESEGEIEENKCRYKLAQEKYNSAIEHYSKAIHYKSDYYPFYNSHGFTLCKLGNILLKFEEREKANDLYLEAIEQHLKAKDIFLNSDSTYRSLGYAYEKLERYEEAKFNYKEAIRINPKSEHSHFLLAKLYSTNNKIEEAIYEYKKTIELNPEFFFAYQNLGSAYVALAEKLNMKAPKEEIDSYYQEAENNYNCAIKYSQKIYQPTEYVLLGQLYSTQKKFEKAIETIGKAVELNPQYSEAYESLSYAYNRLKNYELAKENAQRAIDLDKNNVKAYLHKGFALQNSNHIEIAFQTFKDAELINPNNKEVLLSCAISSERLGNMQTAEEYYNKLLKLTPTYKVVYSFIIFLKNSGRYQEALKLAVNNYSTTIIDSKSITNFDRKLSNIIRKIQNDIKSSNKSRI